MVAGKPVVTRWWWLRHAPVDAPQNQIIGQKDVPATTDDTEPFRAFSALLPDNARWLTSPLKRAQQTATVLREAAALKGQVPVEPHLSEQNFGLWQGLTHDQVLEKYPEEHRIFWTDPGEGRPPEGESFSDVISRTLNAVRAHRGKNDGDVVAIAHAGPIRAALSIALDLAPGKGLSFVIDTLSLTRIDHVVQDGGVESWRVVGVNLNPRQMSF